MLAHQIYYLKLGTHDTNNPLKTVNTELWNLFGIWKIR